MCDLSYLGMEPLFFCDVDLVEPVWQTNNNKQESICIEVIDCIT